MQGKMNTQCFGGGFLTCVKVMGQSAIMWRFRTCITDCSPSTLCWSQKCWHQGHRRWISSKEQEAYILLPDSRLGGLKVQRR